MRKITSSRRPSRRPTSPMRRARSAATRSRCTVASASRGSTTCTSTSSGPRRPSRCTATSTTTASRWSGAPGGSRGENRPVSTPPPPLDGVKIVDLTSYIAGSYAAMQLADLGAAVIKVEALEGDSFRELPGFFGWNRGKRSLAVNLKTPEGRQIVHKLAERADVVMENMRPGVPERLGVGYERLSQINPRLIYSSVTAFGSSGPDSDRPGFDPVFQALGGLMTLQGFGGPPVYLRTAPADYYTAALATQGILSALFARERTGRGQRVETSLLRGALALQAGVAIDYPTKPTLMRDNPTYRLYQAGDSSWFFLAVGNQTFWLKLCKALELEHLADDPRFGSWLARLENNQALLPLIESKFKSRPRDHWLELLAQH